MSTLFTNMNNLLIIVLAVAISVRGHEYNEDYFDDSDEDYDSDEVKYDHKEPHDQNYEAHTQDYHNKVNKNKKVEEEKGSVQWQYTNPMFKTDVKEKESTLQQDIRQVFGSNEDGAKENQVQGMQWGVSGPTTISGITENYRVEQEGTKPSSNGQNIVFFPRFGQFKSQQRLKRQAPLEKQSDLIEIDGTNVKFNEDRGSLTPLGAKPIQAIEEKGMLISADLGSIWTTPEPRLPEQEKNTDDILRPNVFTLSENSESVPMTDHKVDEEVKEDDLTLNEGGNTCCKLNKQSSSTSTQQSLVTETNLQGTENIGLSLINDESVSQITPNSENQPIPLNFLPTEGGLKFNQGANVDFENGYNQGFKDGYHKGAKEGFDHGAKLGCHSDEHYTKEQKPIFEEEIKESGGGNIIVENQGEIAQVETPVVSPMLEEEVKEVGEGNVVVEHEETVAVINIPEDKHHCDLHVKEEEHEVVKLEHEGGIVQVTESAVFPIYEDEVKEISGGGLTVVQTDGAVQAKTPVETPDVQEQKKEVIKTNSKDENKHWHHGHGDHDFDYHGYYYGHHHDHHGYEYHNGNKNSYPQYHGYQNGNKDAHGQDQGFYHGYYHGNHDPHHQGSKDPHYHGSYHGYHHGYPHDSGEWDSSEEGFDSDSEESDTKHHLEKRSVYEPVFYDVKEAPKLFSEFVEKYNKKYIDETEYQKHYMNFVNNLEIINKMNAEGGTATFEINMFADLDDEELSSIIG